MELWFLPLVMPVIVGLTLMLITKNMENKKSTRIHFWTWAAACVVFIVSWVVTT